MVDVAQKCRKLFAKSTYSLIHMLLKLQLTMRRRFNETTPKRHICYYSGVRKVKKAEKRHFPIKSFAQY